MLKSVLRATSSAARRHPLVRKRPAIGVACSTSGYSKTVAIPAHYAGWEHVLLDIDPGSGADIVCDARRLDTLPPAQFDAIYCPHNLEHYYAHDVPKVVAGFTVF